MKNVVQLIGITNFNRLMGIVSGVIILFVTLFVTYDVVRRYFFRMPTTWTVELSEYCLVVVVFLGAGYTLYVGGHVTVDFVLQRLPPKTRTVLNIVTSLAGLAFCALLVWQGTIQAEMALVRDWRGASSMEVPLFPVMVMIPIGGFFLCLQFISKIYGHIRSLFEEARVANS